MESLRQYTADARPVRAEAETALPRVSLSA
jgi:hypothetical protein